MKSGMLLLVALLMTPLGASAQVVGDCWDFWNYSSLTINDPGPGTVSVMVLPDGTGDRLPLARHADGSPADATVTLILADCDSQPIASFPREDMWLESADGGLAVCQGGSSADSNTDAQGKTTWTAPLRAGGHSQAGCQLVISGSVMAFPMLPLSFNSPDLNGDRAVNLSDVALFAGDFWGSYQYRSDLSPDGTLNLSDVARLATAVGRQCP